ncbi:MAG: MFS transporter, partial [Hyphomonadaceae bacterium]
GLAGLIYGFENLGRGAMPAWAPPALLLGGAVFMALFALHASRAPHALLDLSILRTYTFLASLAGGAFNRLIIGSMPFLLALLLQLGFGLSAFAAGALTFVGAAGAFLMKIAAPPILRRYGFRTVLVVNALICAAFTAAIGIFRPETPHFLILAILFVGGFFRSLQFTALNGLAFADIPGPQMSGASSMSSMFQQLALSIGAGLAAILVQIVQRVMGAETLTYAVVSPAFLIVAALSLISLAFFIPLKRDAGADLSGAKPAHPQPVED